MANRTSNRVSEMGATKIAWTEETWNPVVGCTKKSAGCDHCYALAMARRQQGKGTKGYEGIVDANGWAGVRCLPERLDEPLHCKKPRRVFVCSMGDLFHENVPVEFIAQVWAVMIRCRRHMFQVLTKRPERMAAIVGSDGFLGAVQHELIYSEDHYCGHCAAWHEFVGRLDVCCKCEHGYDPGESEEGDPPCPKCGETDYDSTCPTCGLAGDDGGLCCSAAWGDEIEMRWMPQWPIPNIWLGTSMENQQAADERIPHLLKCPAAVRFLSCEPLIGPLDNLPLDGIDWVIVGGETGPGARVCETGWIRSIVAQCRAAGVAVFVKQPGAYTDLVYPYLTGKDPAYWPEDLRVRQYPDVVRDGA